MDDGNSDVEVRIEDGINKLPKEMSLKTAKHFNKYMKERGDVFLHKNALEKRLKPKSKKAMSMTKNLSCLGNILRKSLNDPSINDDT